MKFQINNLMQYENVFRTVQVLNRFVSLFIFATGIQVNNKRVDRRGVYFSSKKSLYEKSTIPNSGLRRS